MYEWRRLTQVQKDWILNLRKKNHLPWHSPQHQDWGDRAYHLTAACYEHQSLIGINPERMTQCEVELLETLQKLTHNIFAWCILPNHYHLLIEAPDILSVIAAVGKLHGRLAHQWNGEDQSRKRKVWFNCVERAIRTDRHYWATMNYIHHNPVHHGYTKSWQDWPYSSSAKFLEEVGREEATRIWREYPVLDYGKGWDNPEM